MLKVRVACVGALSEEFYRSAQEEYVKRLGRYCDIEICQVPDQKAPAQASEAVCDQVRLREGERLLDKIRQDDFVIALDLSGEKLSSPELACRIARHSSAGRRLCYVIGGSLGLSRDVLARANEQLCLSNMTFTHNMARIILLEQLYRGFKINANEPYHK